MCASTPRFSPFVSVGVPHPSIVMLLSLLVLPSRPFVLPCVARTCRRCFLFIVAAVLSLSPWHVLLPSCSLVYFHAVALLIRDGWRVSLLIPMAVGPAFLLLVCVHRHRARALHSIVALGLACSLCCPSCSLTMCHACAVASWAFTGGIVGAWSYLLLLLCQRSHVRSGRAF